MRATPATISAGVKGAVDTGDRDEEAGTDEVAALASLLVPVPHVPAPRDGEDEDADPGGAEDAEREPEHSVVLPRQRDEFACPRCFLVVHVSRRVGDVCRDCA